jgi:phosphate starvation-inducible PhoH-like protein
MRVSGGVIRLMSITETIIDIPIEHEKNVFGSFDSYIKIIEKTLNVTIIERNGEIKVVGNAEDVAKAKSVFLQLLELSKRGNSITEQQVNYALSLSFEEKEKEIVEIDKELICHTVNGKPIKPKTIGQKSYVDKIRKKMIVFGIGPAGTGKTYLAMAMAITAFKNDEVNKIILTRPAIEAGEKLGFLPGDLQSKVDPYLRPLYDALHQIMGSEAYIKNSEKGLIEVAPLAYMRGRTLENAFIILDEAQNTTPAQMKMFLTRIGYGSKVVVTGDLTQKDLPRGSLSGLDMAIKVLSKIDDLGFSYLTGQDVVRHPLVQKIVKAYDAYEDRQKRYSNTEQGQRGYSKIKKGIRAEKIRSNRYENK